MANEVISYLEMCAREGTSLQRGMNFGLRDDHSVLLMSVRPGAPYQDRLEDDGTTLIYEGHDEPRSDAVPRLKAVDQPYRTAYGTLTQNDRFFQAAQDPRTGGDRPSGCACTRSCAKAFGPTSASFVSWTHGKRTTATGRCSSLSWSRSKERRT
jgi:hypothetical protein